MTYRLLWIVIGLMLTSTSHGANQPNQQRWQDLKQEIRNKFPQVPQLSIESFEHNDPGHSILIDVRSNEEYAVSHIKGARNVQDIDKLSKIANNADGKALVLYCSVGYRSSRAASKLIKRGFDNVEDLEGSIFEWANTGHPVFDNGKQEGQVHPYNDDWGQLLDKKYWQYWSR